MQVQYPFGISVVLIVLFGLMSKVNSLSRFFLFFFVNSHNWDSVVRFYKGNHLRFY